MRAAHSSARSRRRRGAAQPRLPELTFLNHTAQRHLRPPPRPHRAKRCLLTASRRSRGRGAAVPCCRSGRTPRSATPTTVQGSRRRDQPHRAGRAAARRLPGPRGTRRRARGSGAPHRGREPAVSTARVAVAHTINDTLIDPATGCHRRGFDRPRGRHKCPASFASGIAAVAKGPNIQAQALDSNLEALVVDVEVRLHGADALTSAIP